MANGNSDEKSFVPPTNPVAVSAKLGKLIVVTGPSGVGKGTLLKLLLAENLPICLSISATTRSPRPNEIDGQHYYFVDRDTFQKMIDAGELLEWAEFAGNLYGTPRRYVEATLQQGRSVLLEIELAGAQQVKNSYPEVLRMFILPPSLAELETRIRKRGQDSEEAIQRRLQRAKEEIAAAAEFDIQIVNGNLAEALAQMKAQLARWLNLESL